MSARRRQRCQRDVGSPLEELTQISAIRLEGPWIDWSSDTDGLLDVTRVSSGVAVTIDIALNDDRRRRTAPPLEEHSVVEHDGNGEGVEEGDGGHR